ncbi:slit homolog 3 protein [Patella vulgata]|uniref:slit homolog 3 protein n=1 Tax=Patella vulgata TaxID=6465 RepID=UPI002180308B|nr:slit homolog 3 protein [Patella vulgata]XP_050412583.1 slit homolog 3 protein [Patella vulgata]XP_050412661.1 slit homolog 3 protein [Patella vulgata]XP_050412734.1 slit homolog 3 protein [Patella vulgata]XP_050412822.1 slit homolog 3 protein [Patella vulgata]XP_050412911.1 slit homolog 3 protein [Patella vulgata]
MNRKLIYKLWIFLWIINILCAAKYDACPQKCNCAVIAGAVNIDCSFQNLSDIKENLLQKAYSLNVSYNKITDITTRFPSNLKNLDLSQNKINSLPYNFSFQFSKLEILNLSNNLLSSVPSNLPNSLKSLRLSFNKIKTVDFNSILNLVNLQSLLFDSNFIEKIETISNTDDQTVIFSKLDTVTFRANQIKNMPLHLHKVFGNVKKLSFSNNSMAGVSDDIFINFHSLTLLDLSWNKIDNVFPNSFNDNLKILSLSDNLMTSLPIRLPMLEWLDISNNKIRKIPELQSGDLYPQEMFMIGGNPFHCDCELLWLKEFYDSRKYLKNLVNVDPARFVPVCASPTELQKQSWDVLDDLLFGCVESEVIKSENIEEDKYTWKINDLYVRIKKIGDTFIYIEWKSTLGLSDVLHISFHPFGKRNLKKKSIMHPHLGKYVIKNLIEKTPYIICISLIPEENILSQVNMPASTDDCHEIVTMETVIDTNFLQAGLFYMVLPMLIVSFLIFYFKIWNNVHIFQRYVIQSNYNTTTDKKNE